MRNQKGVTLIALVITIIVLLILAGVSIAMLTGNNGILTQANKAKVSQIEGQVREEVNLAVQAAKMYAEQKAVETPSGYLAQLNATEIATEMAKDLTTEKSYDVQGANGTAGTPGTAGTVTVTYDADEYKSATNKSDAQIQVVITITGNTFDIGAFDYAD